MNILFCGDENAEDGVLISTLSLLKNSGAKELHLYILTMEAHSDKRKYHPFSKHAADFIRSLLVKANPKNTLELIDCTDLFIKQPPTANMNTRFTPYAMLRLFADELPQIPDRILYLDDDIVIRGDITAFYKQNIKGIELVGVLDYWGRFFFHNVKTKRVFDYLNSGVLLLNMTKIKQTGLFAKVRDMMQTKKMFLTSPQLISWLSPSGSCHAATTNNIVYKRTLRFSTLLLVFVSGLTSIRRQLSHGTLTVCTAYFICTNMMIYSTNISRFAII